MTPTRDDRKLIWIFAGLAVLITMVLMLNYLYSVISNEGRQLKAERTVELRIIPLLKSKHFNFSQNSHLIRSQDFIHAEFTYDSDMDVDFKLRQLSRHITRYDLKGEFEYQPDKTRYVYRIYYNNRQLALFHIIRKEKSYKALMAIILDDFGYNYNVTTSGFLKMDIPLNISIIPGHRYSTQIAEAAARSGHEVMVHMPMEPIIYDGSEKDYILRPGMKGEEVQNRVKKALKELPGAAAMNNHMGSLATANPELMRSLAACLRNEQLLFVDSYTHAGSVVEDVFRPWGLNPLKRDIFLDNEADVDYIRRQLQRSLEIALKYGNVIAIGHNRPATLQALRSMLDEFEQNGVRLIKITDMPPNGEKPL